jgi:putative lipoprotein
MKIILGLGFVSALMTVLCGCQTESPAPPPALLSKSWMLTELDGRPVTAGEGLRPQTLRFDPPRRASGSGGVNRFGGEFKLAGDTVEFGPLLSTRMAGPPAAMDAEKTFLQLLEQTKRWKVTTAGLALSDTNRVLLRFKTDPGGEAPPP